MKAKVTTGTGINGVDVHFTTADLVNLKGLTDDIMLNAKMDEENSSTQLLKH